MGRAAATVIWLTALWLLRVMMRGSGHRLLRYAAAKGDSLRAAGVDIVPRERVIAMLRVGLRVVFWTLALLFTYQWLGYVLSRFPYTRSWGEQFANFLVDTLEDMLTATADSVPGLLVAILILVIAKVANSMLGSFFDGVQSGRLLLSWIDADSARPTRRLVTIAVCCSASRWRIHTSRVPKPMRSRACHCCSASWSPSAHRVSSGRPRAGSF